MSSQRRSIKLRLEKAPSKAFDALNAFSEGARACFRNDDQAILAQWGCSSIPDDVSVSEGAIALARHIGLVCASTNCVIHASSWNLVRRGS